jgi:hypothetical protein
MWEPESHNRIQWLSDRSQNFISCWQVILADNLACLRNIPTDYELSLTVTTNIHSLT